MKQEIIKYIKNIGKKATIPKKILEHFISHYISRTIHYPGNI